MKKRKAQRKEKRSEPPKEKRSEQRKEQREEFNYFEEQVKAAVSEAKEKRDSLIKDLSEKTKGLCDAASKEESKRKIKQLHSECKRRLERWCEDYIKYIKGMKEGEQTDMSGVRKIMNQLNSAIHDYDEATADVMDDDIGPDGINLDFTRRRRRK